MLWTNTFTSFTLQGQVTQIRLVFKIYLDTYFLAYLSRLSVFSLQCEQPDITRNAVFSVLIWTTFIDKHLFVANQPHSKKSYRNSCNFYVASLSELSVLLRDSCWEVLTDVVKGKPWHPEILDEICYCKVIHITIPPLLALQHPHTHTYTSIQK